MHLGEGVGQNTNNNSVLIFSNTNLYYPFHFIFDVRIKKNKKCTTINSNCAIFSGVAWRNSYTSNILNFKHLTIVCCCTARFGISKYGFSHDEVRDDL